MLPFWDNIVNVDSCNPYILIQVTSPKNKLFYSNPILMKTKRITECQPRKKKYKNYFRKLKASR